MKQKARIAKVHRAFSSVRIESYFTDDFPPEQGTNIRNDAQLNDRKNSANQAKEAKNNNPENRVYKFVGSNVVHDAVILGVVVVTGAG